jgi:hypothetical protein
MTGPLSGVQCRQEGTAPKIFKIVTPAISLSSGPPGWLLCLFGMMWKNSRSELLGGPDPVPPAGSGPPGPTSPTGVQADARRRRRPINWSAASRAGPAFGRFNH